MPKLFEEEVVIISGGAGGDGFVEWRPGYEEDPPTLAVAASLPTLSPRLDVPVVVTPTLPTLALVHDNIPVVVTPTLPELALDATKAVVVTPAITFTVNQLLASKDCYVDVIALCPTDATSRHDLVDLIVDGVVATRKDMMVGWNLTGIQSPSTATVTGATLHIYAQTGATVTGVVTCSAIADAGETWSETGVLCSTIPAPVDAAFSYVTGPTGERAINASAAGRARIQARLGTSSCSVRGVLAAPATNSVTQSKDSGGTPGNASGPRLSITLTVP